MKPWIIMGCVIAAFVWLLYALGDILTPFYCGGGIGLCIESAGGMVAEKTD